MCVTDSKIYKKQ